MSRRNKKLRNLQRLLEEIAAEVLEREGRDLRRPSRDLVHAFKVNDQKRVEECLERLLKQYLK